MFLIFGGTTSFQMDLHLKCSLRLFLFSLLCFSFVINAEFEPDNEPYELNIEICFKPPKDIIQVVYPGGVTVTRGKYLAPQQVASPPSMLSWHARPGYNYTLALVDVTSMDIQILHWLVINIRGNDVAHGEVIESYFPPQSSSETSLYAFVVYRQKREKILRREDIFISPPVFSPFMYEPIETNFDIQEFADMYHFGNPVAYTYFRINSSSAGQ